MNPDQFSQLLAVLIKIADKRPVITEAADWGMLAAVVTMFGAIVVGMIGVMWHDLKTGFASHQVFDEKEHCSLKAECKEKTDVIWAAMKDCQEDCCPPRRRKDEP